MELDDLKNSWHQATGRVEKPQIITRAMLEKINRTKYRQRIKKIITAEIAGSSVCLVAALYIGYSFNKLDTAFLQVTGVVAILLLLLLPTISFVSIRQLSKAGNVNKSYAETLKAFAVDKKRFIRLQKLNITFSYVLLLTMIVLLVKLFGGNDLSENKHFWLFSFPISYIFLLFYAKWVQQYYQQALQQAEELLAELNT